MAKVALETRGSGVEFEYFSSIAEFGIADKLQGVRIETGLTKAGARTLRDELDKYIGDKPKPVAVDWIAAELRLDTARFKLELEKANAARLLKSTLDGLAKPVKPAVPSWDAKSGDKVKLHGRDALVTNVRRDYLFGTRRGESVTIELDMLAPPVPPKPLVPVVKVGDVINGDTLRAVQWKRGTIIKTTFGNSFVLNADSRWVSLETGKTHAFSEFQALPNGKPVYTVQHAPGKAA